jgi:type IX secretion system PorP/SprF family membrane protein
MTIQRTIISAVTLLLLTAAQQVKAQVSPFQAIYYQNPYLYNPATAGINSGLTINTGYRQQWSGFPGAPKTGAFTAEYQASDNVGLGLNISDERAGLIRQTRVMGTYAYRIRLGERNQQLHFGLSFGIDDARVDYNSINGDATDGQVAQYNQLNAYVDGDFGIAYTNNNLYIGAAVPNLKAAFFKNSDSRFDANRSLFVGIASYKISLQSDNRNFLVEPLVGYRIVKGYSDMVDGGFNFTMSNYGLSMQAIYQSSKNVGLGLGLDMDTYALNFAYNIDTAPLQGYTRGAFEFGIKLRLFKKG